MLKNVITYVRDNKVDIAKQAAVVTILTATSLVVTKVVDVTIEAVSAALTKDKSDN